MLFVDDLHWADQSTLDLISALLLAPRPGLLIMLAARKTFVPPWPAARLELMELEALDDPELVEMAAMMPEGSELSESERRDLIERCDGMPLFLEELVRTADALERGAPVPRAVEFADYRVPPALLDPLLARLASPGVDLDLAQVAATIGREVDGALVCRVTGVAPGEYELRLQTLIDAGLVEPDGDGVTRFATSDPEVAYETQARDARRALHGRVADALLEDGPGSGLTDAGEAAFHLERARRYGEAIEARVGAAQGHQALGAHTEALRELTQALDLLVHVPEGPERWQTELMVRELRSFSAVMAGGYAAPEAADDHGRCVELCEGFGLPPELLPSLIPATRSTPSAASSRTPGASPRPCGAFRRPAARASRPTRWAKACSRSSAAGSASRAGSTRPSSRTPGGGPRAGRRRRGRCPTTRSARCADTSS